MLNTSLTISRTCIYLCCSTWHTDNEWWLTYARHVFFREQIQDGWLATIFVVIIRWTHPQPFLSHAFTDVVQNSQTDKEWHTTCAHHYFSTSDPRWLTGGHFSWKNLMLNMSSTISPSKLDTHLHSFIPLLSHLYDWLLVSVISCPSLQSFKSVLPIIISCFLFYPPFFLGPETGP